LRSTARKKNDFNINSKIAYITAPTHVPTIILISWTLKLKGIKNKKNNIIIPAIKYFNVSSLKSKDILKYFLEKTICIVSPMALERIVATIAPICAKNGIRIIFIPIFARAATVIQITN
jgi:hypothetical protein